MKTTKCFVFTVCDSDDSNEIVKVFSFNKQGYEYACKYLLNYAKECLDEDEYSEYTWRNNMNFFNIGNNKKIAPSFNEFINCYKNIIVFSNGVDIYFCLSVIEMNVFQENLDIE